MYLTLDCTFAAIAMNEFLAPRWAKFTDSLGVPAGISILRSHSIHTETWWIWLGVGAALIGALFFNVGTWLFHAYLDRNPLPLPTFPCACMLI